MISRHRVRLVAWGCAAILGTASAALAQNATGVLSPDDITRELKPRGLPTPGPMPAGPNPAIAPANALSAPVSEPYTSGGRPVPPPVSPQPAPVLPKVTLNISFEFGSAQLKPQSIRQLRSLGIALNQQLKDEKTLLIEGHTDKSGTPAYNVELSGRRADAVKEYLVKEMGVSADRMETVGKGFSELVNPKNPYGAENRRVVVVNLGGS